MEAKGVHEAVTASFGCAAARWAILVHGGAGDVRKEGLPEAIAGCERAAAEAARILVEGGSALDAVQRAVELLEDDPHFNAGNGACLTEDGRVELDASIMDGIDLRAGAVCALPPFKNAVAIARRVMEASPHVLLAGAGAERFAIAHGFARLEERALVTEAAEARWQLARAARGAESRSGGTVGAVARDPAGHVAAATSTGGMVNKLAGRVGDSPLIGAGTYADDLAGACSTTGHGEAMIRVCLAKTAVEHLRAGAAAEAAARAALQTMSDRTKLTGGAILVAPDGSLGLARTTRSMTWAAISEQTRASGG